MRPQQLGPLQPQVVLAIGAHPDDMDFGAGGTLAHFAKQGAKVHYLQLSDGGSGSKDRDTNRKQLARTRQQEQDAACSIIGGTHVEYLHFVDGQLENTLELKTCVTRTIRKLKPDVVITMDPTMVYAAEFGIINHPDHRAAGQATLDAVYPLARDHLSLPSLYEQGYEPHAVSTVLLINFNASNYHVDISEDLETKLKAVRSHSSQLADPEAMCALFTKQAETAGKLAACRYAESFIRLDIQP